MKKSRKSKGGRWVRAWRVRSLLIVRVELRPARADDIAPLVDVVARRAASAARPGAGGGQEG